MSERLEDMTTGQLIARVRKLEVAIKPFTKAALAYPDPGSGTPKIVAETPSKQFPNYLITSRDLWIARKAVSPEAPSE